MLPNDIIVHNPQGRIISLTVSALRHTARWTCDRGCSEDQGQALIVNFRTLEVLNHVAK